MTILYNFEKQWLSSFSWKAIVVRPAQQKFICLVKDGHGTFYNEKICKDKDLIWHMVGGLHNALPPLSAQEKISSENVVREEWAIPVCQGDNDKNLGKSLAYGGMSKIEQIEFFDSQMYLQ